MFAKATHVGFAQRVVATLVASALMLWSLGAYATAQAASLVDVSNTLGDSDLSVTSSHFISFDVPTGSSIGAGDTITINFPAGGVFTGVAGTVSGNLEVRVDGGAPVAIGSFASVAQNISFDQRLSTLNFER